VQFENACPKSRVSPPSINWGPKNHLFWITSQLHGKFNGLYLRNRIRYRQSVKCVDNEESPTSSQNFMNFGPLIASNSTCILLTLRKFCIPLHCQASQTEISKRNSTKLCQTVEVNRANNLP